MDHDSIIMIRKQKSSQNCGCQKLIRDQSKSIRTKIQANE
jgi:hypothetical protein